MLASPRSSERGSVIILTALALVTLLTLASLAISASWAYDKRNVLGAAADAAAKSAATELLRNAGLSPGSLQNYANQQVQAHGLTPTASACGTPTLSTVSVCLNHPPITGAFIGDPSYVEVTVQEQTSTFFGLSPISVLQPLARAVAGSANPVNCFVTFQDFQLGNTGGGNSHLNMHGCGVAIGGTAAAGNASGVGITYSDTQTSPAPVSISSGVCTGGGCPLGDWNGGTAPSPSDPLSLLPDYTTPTGANCPAGAAGTAATLPPGCYTSIATSVTNLQAGIYYITGTVHIQQLTATSGTMLYLACATAPCSNGGALESISGGGGGGHFLSITAPSTGTYEGIAIFQDRQNSTPWNIPDNNFTINLTGAIYAPKADLSISNALNITSTGCALLIANSFSVKNGNGDYSNTSCASTFAGAAFLSVSLAE